LANRSPEQDLISEFVSSLKSHADESICIDSLYNDNCKSRKFADIEFMSKSGQRWAIEAKSNDSKDAHNSVHKIFGELLKETGRDYRDECLIGILIPEDSMSFYSRLFQSINREKFIQFGNLIPIESVFTYGVSDVGKISWEDLYDYH
jgi:hypothetical protein